MDRDDAHWALPEAAAESYAELVDLDAAHRLRWARAVASPRALDPDPLDLEILALVAGTRHVLTTQIHRRFNPQRALTTTQRRLKRLSDAALVERFQFHRRDGGGAPMCYVIAPRGLDLLAGSRTPGPHPPRGPRGTRPLSQILDLIPIVTYLASVILVPLRAAPVVLAVRRGRTAPAAPGPPRRARHRVDACARARPWRVRAEVARTRGVDALPAAALDLQPGRVAIGPADLRLPGGRAPHDFLRTDCTGARVEVERFETVRPDVSVELPPSTGGVGVAGVCLLVELDDRLSTRAHAVRRRQARALRPPARRLVGVRPPPRWPTVRSVAALHGCWSCSSAATAPARGSAPGGPTTC